jgi:D-amino peptidase
MKLFVSADIEGVGGLAHFDAGTVGVFDYPEARAWMTAEVAAACEGAREADCEAVIVADSHYDMRNILWDRLPTYVTLVRSPPRPLLMMQGVETEGVVGAALVGYHVGAASAEGLCPHTMSGGVFTDITVDGVSVSETHISAWTAGEFGVPVIMASGDDAYVRHARAVLGEDIETVVTKTALSHTSASTRPPQVCCADIRAAVARAVRNHGRRRPTRRDWPAQVDFILKRNRMAELLAMLPMYERVNGYTVRSHPASAIELSRALDFILQAVSLR